jgi:hypothetical protein
MPNADVVPVLSHQVPAGDSEPEPVRTISNQKSILKHKHSGSDAHSHGGVAATLLEEDPFSSEASKVLFDGVDDLRRCGAAVDLNLPQVSLLCYVFITQLSLYLQ